MFLREVFRSGFEGEGTVLLLDHLEDSNGVSIGQPRDKSPALTGVGGSE